MGTSLANDAFVNRTVEQYADMMLRIAYQHLKNQADAEDAVQEVFIKFMRQPPFDSEKHTKAWLIRATINQCKDIRKSAWFRKTVPLSDSWQPFSREQQSILEEVWSLPPRDRDMLYLYYFEGYTVPEMAKILVEKENTVSSRLTRARKKLREVLVEGGYQYE